MILPEDEVNAVLGKVIAENPGKTMGIGVSGGETGSTRFANSAITTNGVYSRLTVSVEVFKGRKRGVAEINELVPDRIREAVSRADALADLAPENTELMPPLGPQAYLKIPPLLYSNTAVCTPGRRVEAIAAAIERANKANLNAAGFFETGSTFSGYLNSRGLWYYHASSRAYYSNTMRGEGCSGWAAGDEEDVDRLVTDSLAERAVQKAIASRDPKTAAPGRYPVILEPAAVADLVWYMAFNFTAREADEGRSFLSVGEGKNRIGEKLFSPEVTIFSDPGSSASPSSPVGEDGLAQKKTVWVDRGVVQNLVYTRFWAEKMRKEPVPFPSNLIMKGGPHTVADLVRSTAKGILVSRLWYIRDLNPMILLLTGLTRDGVFWIEDGAIRHPVKNFRFNESPVNVLKNAVMMSAPVRAVGGETGMSAVVPALKVENFNFSSVSEAV
jgi:predicted Zn-dependent protease